MKKLLCLVVLLGACSAEAIPEAATSESALVAPRPIGGCAVVRCPKGTMCEENCGQARCVPIEPKPECVTDADCRLFSDYCEGCNCVALGHGEPNPKCNGNIVQCFVDPCLNLQAQCVYGSCVAGNAAQ